MSEEPKSKTTPAQEKFFNPMVRLMSRLDRFFYRVSGNSVLRLFGKGAPTLLLTTVGRKSGKPRTTPVLYLRDGDEIVIVASKGGMPHHPLWYLNIEANPRVEVEIEGKKSAMVARRAKAEEKAQLWHRLVMMFPDFGVYQARTERDIPVLILSPQ